MELCEVLPLVRQWRSADAGGRYVGIRRGGTDVPEWYADGKDVPAAYQALEVARIEVCTGGRVVYHLA